MTEKQMRALMGRAEKLTDLLYAENKDAWNDAERGTCADCFSSGSLVVAALVLAADDAGELDSLLPRASDESSERNTP